MRSTSLSTAGGRRRRRRRQQQQQQQQQWLTYSSHLLSAALRDGGDDDVDNAYLSDHDADAPEFQACGLVWKLTATPFKPAPEYLGLRLVPVPKPRRGGGPAQAQESEAEAADEVTFTLDVLKKQVWVGGGWVGDGWGMGGGWVGWGSQPGFSSCAALVCAPAVDWVMRSHPQAHVSAFDCHPPHPTPHLPHTHHAELVCCRPMGRLSGAGKCTMCCESRTRHFGKSSTRCCWLVGCRSCCCCFPPAVGWRRAGPAAAWRAQLPQTASAAPALPACPPARRPRPKVWIGIL